jgi:hypothetical protein
MPTGLPATEPVPVYPCRVESGDVVVDVLHPHDPGTDPETDRNT